MDAVLITITIGAGAGGISLLTTIVVVPAVIAIEGVALFTGLLSIIGKYSVKKSMSKAEKHEKRERGLRGYSRLRKAELIQRLRASRAQILDQDIDARMANAPFSTPTPYTLPKATPAPSLNAVEDLINYLDNNVREIPESVSPRVKKLQEEIKSIYNRMKLFEVRGSNSALRNFARVYTIDGIEGYDALSFLQNARKNITNVLRINRKRR